MAGKFSPTVSPTNPVQHSAASDGDVEDCSDENQLIEVQLFYFDKGEAGYSISSSPSVHDLLKAHISFWRRLQASDFILSTLYDGYKIPFFVYAVVAAPDCDTEFDLNLIKKDRLVRPIASSLLFTTVLQAFEDKRFDACIKWFIDNQATTRIVDIGRMKLQLHHLAYKIFSYCFQHNIDVHVQWIPRELSTQTNFVSKIRHLGTHVGSSFIGLFCLVLQCKNTAFFLSFLESWHSWS